MEKELLKKSFTAEEQLMVKELVIDVANRALKQFECALKSEVPISDYLEDIEKSITETCINFKRHGIIVGLERSKNGGTDV